MTKEIIMPRNKHLYSNNYLCDNLVLFAVIKKIIVIISEQKFKYGIRVLIFRNTQLSHIQSSSGGI